MTLCYYNQTSACNISKSLVYVCVHRVTKFSIMRNIVKAWRDSATIIMLAKTNNSLASRPCNDRRNYDILLQTRPNTASNFANAVVFPGGVTEAADASEKWIQLIKSYGYKQHHFNSLHCSGSAVNLVFGNNPVQSHVSLRITAIREAFEETGLLLCSRKHCDNRLGPWAELISDIDLSYWTEKLYSDPDALYKLCVEQKCYPDIWSLHYWSNWLSPVVFKKRFDTAFFVAALEQKPLQTHVTNSETASLEWLNIQEIFERNQKGVAALYPPQIYELTRFSQFTSIEDLVTFAARRSGHATDHLFPHIIRTNDGAVFLLPGDDLYPTTVDYSHEITKSDKTVHQWREGVRTLHRFEKLPKLKEFTLKSFGNRSLNHISFDDLEVKVRVEN